MKQQLTANRTHFIHDFDGVHLAINFFQHTDTDPHRFYGLAKIAAANEIMPDGWVADANFLQTCKENYLNTGDGLAIFRDLAKAHKLDEHALYSDAHRLYHRISFDMAVKGHGHGIVPCEKSIDAFEQLKGHVQHGLLTMSCLDNWARPLLTTLKLVGYFNPSAMMGAGDVGFKNKANSTYPLAFALQRMNAQPENAVFIEDSLKNLATAKTLDEGILTVFVSETAIPDSIPPFVDIHVRKVADFLEMARDVIVAKPLHAQTYHQPSYGFGS